MMIDELPARSSSNCSLVFTLDFVYFLIDLIDDGSNCGAPSDFFSYDSIFDLYKNAQTVDTLFFI